jgi:monoamine oxidase
VCLADVLHAAVDYSRPGLVPQRLDGSGVHLREGGQPERVVDLGSRIAPCGPGARRVQGGYATLTKCLADTLPAHTIRLNCRVTSLQHSDSHITLVCSAPASSSAAQPATPETFRALRVVVATPPRLAALLSYSPPLPMEQLRFMQATAAWAGDWSKVVVTFGRAFWRERGECGAAATPSCPLASVWWEAGGGDSLGEVAALAGLAVGGEAAAFMMRQPDASDAGVSPESVRTRVTDLVRSLWGSDAAALIVNITHKAWSKDDLTFAPPPPASSGSQRDPRLAYGHALLKRPLPWGVLFCGTETEAMSGHVEGAILAGERAASEALVGLQRA